MFFKIVPKVFAWTAGIMATLLIGVAVYSGNVLPPRLIAIFDSGVPGTPESYAALQFASEAGIDQIINYSSVNSDAVARDRYLLYAKQLGVSVQVSTKDFVGPLDHDPANASFHAQYGSTNDERVVNIAQTFESNPYAESVWGYFIADEPESKDLTAVDVRVRHDQIKSVTSKPTLSSYWRFDRNDLAVRAQGSDHLMMDYYPYPEGPNQTYGEIGDIESIARDMNSVAGNNSWFALQAFSYYVSEPDMIQRFNFPAVPPDDNQGAPDAYKMADMAKRALQGGARNLAIFSFGYAQQVEGQLQEVKKAVRLIRSSPEFL